MARTREDVARQRQRYIDRGHIGEGLGHRASRSTLLTLSGSAGRYVLQIVGAVVLARLLTPQAYGLVGMVTAVVGLAEVLRDFGLSTAVVQRDKLSHHQVNALFWISVGMGIFIALSMVLLAPALAAFYGEPQLVGITRAIAVTFLLTALISMHQGLLARQMRFGWLLTAEVSSIGLSIVAGVVVAVLGFGYWALVVRTVAQAAVRAVVVWIGCRWRPTRPARAEGMKPLLTFGGNQSMTQALTYVARTADDVIIGRFLGAGALGLYDKAYQLLLLPINQINAPIQRVAVPTLSYLKDQPERYRRFYSTAIGVSGYVAVPGILVVVVLADPAVPFVLGEQWTRSAQLFQILGIAGVVQTLSHSNHWLYTSTAQVGREAGWSSIARPLTVVSFFLGLPWGVEGVAWSFTIVQYLLFVPGLVHAHRGTPVTTGDWARAAWRPITVALIAAGTAWVVKQQLLGAGSLTILLAAGAASLLAYALVVAVWPEARREVLKLVTTARSGLRGRSG